MLIMYRDRRWHTNKCRSIPRCTSHDRKSATDVPGHFLLSLRYSIIWSTKYVHLVLRVTCLTHGLLNVSSTDTTLTIGMTAISIGVHRVSTISDISVPCSDMRKVVLAMPAKSDVSRRWSITSWKRLGSTRGLRRAPNRTEWFRSEDLSVEAGVTLFSLEYHIRGYTSSGPSVSSGSIASTQRLGVASREVWHFCRCLEQPHYTLLTAWGFHARDLILTPEYPTRWKGETRRSFCIHYEVICHGDSRDGCRLNHVICRGCTGLLCLCELVWRWKRVHHIHASFRASSRYWLMQYFITSNLSLLSVAFHHQNTVVKYVGRNVWKAWTL